jgi:hypothetical protein
MRFYRINLRVGPAMEPGHAEVSTAMQDLERHLDAIVAAGIEPKHIYPDKKSGSTLDRPGLAGCWGIPAMATRSFHTLDRLGRTSATP